MNNKFHNFDDIIRNKLTQLDLSGDLPDWEAFEKKLDATYQDNTSFDDDSFIDELAYTKLANQEVPYKPEHWTEMSERIEYDRILTRKLIKYKLIETVLVVFAIFTFINLFPVRKEIKNNLKEKIEQFQHKLNGKEQPNIKQERLQKAVIEPSKPMAIVIPGEEDNELIAENENISSTGSSVIHPMVETRKLAPVVDRLSQRLPAAVSASPYDRDDGKVLSLLGDNQHAVDYVENETEKTAGVAVLPMPGGSPVTVSNSARETALSLLKSKISRKKVFSFSGVAGLDANYINTPYDGVSDVGSDTTSAVGYTGGFNFNVQFSRIGIQTGLIYSFKRYRPNTPSDILQAQNFRFKEEFNGIELDIVQFPLNTRYDYFVHKNDRLYLLGGASLNVIARANYDVLYKQENSLAAPPNPAQFAYATSHSDLNKKDFEKGVIAGGRFADNAYITANFSLGYEHYISPRISFFLQPAFQYYFPFQDGQGPNKDKIHTYSLLLGTKVSVW